MKKLLFACAITCVGFSGLVSASYADTNEKMKDSKYCMTNGSDPICMGPEMMKMRMEMMKMTKKGAMKNRAKFCMTNGDDPVCDPKMMHSSMGF